MPIIVSKKGANAQLVNKSGFKNEAMLQEYILKNPEAIPVYELEEDKKLFVVKREFQTNSGPIDALAVDKDGDIYVVETKLYKNPDKRKVVAQAMDYGAALWKYFIDFNEFLEILSDETQRNFGLNFHEKIMDFFNVDELETGTTIENLRKNLNEGIIKFVILMDSVDERLKDLIIYINQNSQFDIYAVQLEYYKFEEYEILIPKIFGAEVKKTVKKYTKSKQWDRESWFAKIEEITKDVEYVNTVKRFEELVAGKPFYFHFSSQRKDEKATYWVRYDPKNYSSKIFGFVVNGNIELPFGELKKNPPFDGESMRHEFIQRLNQIPGITKFENIEGRPTFPLSLLRNEKALTQFCEVIDWCIQEIGKVQDK